MQLIKSIGEMTRASFSPPMIDRFVFFENWPNLFSMFLFSIFCETGRQGNVFAIGKDGASILSAHIEW